MHTAGKELKTTLPKAGANFQGHSKPALSSAQPTGSAVPKRAVRRGVSTMEPTSARLNMAANSHSAAAESYQNATPSAELPQEKSVATEEQSQKERGESSTSLEKDIENLRVRPEDSDQLAASSENQGDDDEDEEYVTLLSKMRQVLSLDRTKSQKVLKPLLETFDLEGIASHIKEGKAQKILVMCGAGISVSAGIPDFRSPGTGLYNNLQKYNLPHPQAVFELDYFRKKPGAFYQLAKELFPGNFKPTPAHYFMTLLHKKGLLLRCFTQNIDSLERQAGLPSDRIIAAHGNFDTAHCIKCRTEVSLQTVKEAVLKEQPCMCPKCRGLVKPDIVFFGEKLPEAFFHHAETDFPQADLLIVMGTSLVVNPFASLIDHVEDHVPRVLINRERVGEADATLMLLGYKRGFQFDEEHRDALFLGDCDEGVRQLARLLGWEAELDALIHADTTATPTPVAQSDL